MAFEFIVLKRKDIREINYFFILSLGIQTRSKIFFERGVTFSLQPAAPYVSREAPGL